MSKKQSIPDVYVFRHGAYNNGEITEKSRFNAEKIGEDIRQKIGKIPSKSIKIISSDILRAIQTAEAIAKGIGINIDKILKNDALTLNGDENVNLGLLYDFLKQLDPYQVLILLTHQPIANIIALGLGYSGNCYDLPTLGNYNFPLNLSNEYYEKYLLDLEDKSNKSTVNNIPNDFESDRIINGLEEEIINGLTDEDYSKSIVLLELEDFGGNIDVLESDCEDYENEIDKDSGIDQIRDEGLEKDYFNSMKEFDTEDFSIGDEENDFNEEKIEFLDEIDEDSGINQIRDEELEDEYNKSFEGLDDIIGDDRVEGIDQHDILQEIQSEKIEFLLSGNHKEVDELICKTLVSINVSKEDILLVSLSYICESRIQQRFNSVTYGALFFQKLLHILNSGDFYGYVNLESISKIYMYYQKNSKYLKDFDNVDFESTIDNIANTYIETILLNTNLNILQECNRLVLPIKIHIRIFQILNEEIGKITTNNIGTHIEGGRFLSIILGNDFLDNGVIKVLINNNKFTDTQSIEELKKYLSFKLVEKYGSMGFIDSINNLILPY